MPITQIKKIDNTVCLLLTDEILNLLNLQLNDEVVITVSEHNLIMSPLNEWERQQKINEAIKHVFNRRITAYQKLAEGVAQES